jgi:hypothetical protein
MKAPFPVAVAFLLATSSVVAQRIDVVYLSNFWTIQPWSAPAQSLILRFETGNPAIGSFINGATTGQVGLSPGSCRAIGAIRGFLPSTATGPLTTGGVPNSGGIGPGFYSLEYISPAGAPRGAVFSATISASGIGTSSGSVQGIVRSGLRLDCDIASPAQVIMDRQVFQSTTTIPPNVLTGGSATTLGFFFGVDVGCIAGADLTPGSGLQIINDVRANGILTLD